MTLRATRKRPLRKWLCDCPKCGRAVTYREDDVWLCRCDCGRGVLVRREDLRSGKVTSCRFCDASQNDEWGGPEMVKHGEVWTPEHAFDDQAMEILNAGGYAC